MQQLMRWLAARGVTHERLEAYREGIVQILHEAGGGAVEPHHVEAARRSLQAAGARPRTLAHLKDAGDALRRFQRGDGPPPSATAPVGPPASPPIATAVVTIHARKARPLYIASAVAAGMVMVGVAASAYVWMFKAATGMDAAFQESQAISSPEGIAVRKTYLNFHKAMLAGDMPALRELATPEQLAELDGPDAEQKMALARALFPTDVHVTQVKVTGDTATLRASARLGEQRAKGTVALVKQGGSWKIRKVAWKVQLENDPAEDVARPAELPKLQGVWKGRETGAGTEWTLTFSSPYRLSAGSSSGESYSGEVMIRWDLGVRQDSIPVPPGWAPLDVAIDQASAPEAIGKVALAAFSLTQGELRFCGGPPGFGSRVASFESPGPPFRCLTLNRVGEAPNAPAASETPPTNDAVQGPSGAAFAPEGPGEAALLLDGVAERYPLQIGFFSETRVAAPERATFHFAAPAPPHSNARRIVLTLDATRTGQHYADGQEIHDQMFNDKPVVVGELKDGARATVLKWVADGGQSFPPKLGTRCSITVSSPYTGTDDSDFQAEIAHCAVHSAGIDRTLASVKLRVKGKLER
jgi:hypothetical protein